MSHDPIARSVIPFVLLLTTLIAAPLARALPAQTKPNTPAADASNPSAGTGAAPAAPRRVEIDLVTPATGARPEQPAASTAPKPAEPAKPAGTSGAAIPPAQPAPADPAQPRFNRPIEDRPLGRSDSADDSARQDPGRLSSTSAWGIQTFVALAVVIGLILGIRYFMIRMGYGRQGRGVSGLVEVLARASLGPRAQLLFLKIKHRVVVVAQSPSGFDTITTLEDAEDVAWLLGQVEASRANSVTRTFQNLVSGFDKEYQPEKPADPQAQESADKAEQALDSARNEVSALLGKLKSITKKDPEP